MKTDEFLEELADATYEFNVELSELLCALKLLQENGASIGDRRRCLRRICELQELQKITNHIRAVAVLFADKGEKVLTAHTSLNYIVRRWLSDQVPPEGMQFVEELVNFVKEKDNALWGEILLGYSTVAGNIDLF